MRSACDKTNYDLKQSVTQALLLFFVCVFVLWGVLLKHVYKDDLYIFKSSTRAREREREMFYLTTHSTHFIYGYMASGNKSDKTEGNYKNPSPRLMAGNLAKFVLHLNDFLNSTYFMKLFIHMHK